jgi:hypothetical protein
MPAGAALGTMSSLAPLSTRESPSPSPSDFPNGNEWYRGLFPLPPEFERLSLLVSGNSSRLTIIAWLLEPPSLGMGSHLVLVHSAAHFVIWSQSTRNGHGRLGNEREGGRPGAKIRCAALREKFDTRRPPPALSSLNSQLA